MTATPRSYDPDNDRYWNGWKWVPGATVRRACVHSPSVVAAWLQAQPKDFGYLPWRGYVDPASDEWYYLHRFISPFPHTVSRCVWALWLPDPEFTIVDPDLATMCPDLLPILGDELDDRGAPRYIVDFCRDPLAPKIWSAEAPWWFIRKLRGEANG